MLALGLVGGCSSSNGGGGPGDDDGGKDAGRLDGGGADSGLDGGESDADPNCEPKGCTELGLECGMADDGCGGPLDCGNACDNFDTCGGGGVANQCGCTPLTCETLAPGQKACGETINDGCGGTIPGGCGGCEDQGGAGWACNAVSSVCECAGKSQAQACAEAGKSCGRAADGCGGDGYDCGTCGAGKSCTAEGTCACDAAYAPTACAGKTCGTVTVDGCEYPCGAACNDCAPPVTSCATCACGAGQVCKPGSLTCCSAATAGEIAQLCAGRGCDETVADPCTGEVISCACAGGQGCVDPAYIEGATKSTCLPSNEAALLGGYVVRTHQYTSFILGPEKAETVSLVTISKKADGSFQMVDKGCVATTSTAPSVAPSYFNLPSAVVPVLLNGNEWTRGEVVPTPPVGFEPALPAFCPITGGAPTAAPDYDTESSDIDTSATPSSGSQKAWLQGDKTCTCPAMAETCSRSSVSQGCVPKQNVGAPSNAKDCRLNDPDRDSRPGFTVIAQATGKPVTAASVGATKWAGTLQPSGFHAGRVTEPSPFFRAFQSCGDEGSGGGTLCNLLNAASTSHTCGSNGTKFNRAHFAKLSRVDFSKLTCGNFYNRALDGPGGVASATTWNTGANTVHTAVNSTAINSYFTGARGATCAGPAECAEGSICNAGRCWPMTTPNACTSNAHCNSNPANTNSPAWVCRSDKSCGPASCPMPPPPG